MADNHYVVQAYHYAQFMVTRDDDEGFEVEILDEDDTELEMVAVRGTLEEAVAAGEEWREMNDPDDVDTRGTVNMPLAGINVYEVPAGTVGKGTYVQSVEH